MRVSKNVWLAGGMATAVVLAFYPIYFRPKLYPAEYKEAQKRNRAVIPKDKLRQSGMKEWSDPFAKEKPKSKES